MTTALISEHDRTFMEAAKQGSFGSWLKQAREARGWTLEALAAEMDSAPGSISMLESGDRNPSRKMVSRIAAALYQGDPDGYAAFEAVAMLAAAFLPNSSESEITYHPVLSEIYAASSDNTLDERDVEEILATIRMKREQARRRRSAN